MPPHNWLINLTSYYEAKSGPIIGGQDMTAALLDRLTHRCDIFEMNGESYRFRESMKTKKEKDPKKGK
jgi:DNA replication protein DnaC